MEIKEIPKRIFRKSYLGAFLFAFALWGYTSLSGIYTTLVNMPVIIKLPDDRAFEEPPPQYLMIEAKGNGWNLFNFIFFNNSKKIFLDLSQTKISESDYLINRSQILKGIQSMERVELSNVLTESISIHTGKVSYHDIPIEPKLTINTAEGFTLVGVPKLIPEFVEIRGNDKIVRNIDKWSTKPAVFEDINKPFSETLELSDTLKGIIRLGTNTVKFNADIQQTAEITFNELRIKIRGGSIPKNHILHPEFVTITFRGGINDIIDLNPDKISVTLNYADIMSDKSGVLMPKIEFPGNLQIINLIPRYITNYKIIRTNSLSLNN